MGELPQRQARPSCLARTLPQIRPGWQQFGEYPCSLNAGPGSVGKRGLAGRGVSGKPWAL